MNIGHQAVIWQAAAGHDLDDQHALACFCRLIYLSHTRPPVRSGDRDGFNVDLEMWKHGRISGSNRDTQREK